MDELPEKMVKIDVTITFSIIGKGNETPRDALKIVTDFTTQLGMRLSKEHRLIDGDITIDAAARQGTLKKK